MLSKEDREEIASIVKLTVNGKIDNLHIKVDDHRSDFLAFMERLDPVIDALSWLTTTKKVITWVGGVAAAVAATIALIKYLK